MNDPKLYQIEDPSSNRSHQFEDKSAAANVHSQGLHRPYIRKDVRAQVEANAPKNEKGQFLDANTGKPIEGIYDLGHKAGHEFKTEQAKAEKEGLTQAQFNERMNNPDLYQIEDPSSNRSHQFEAAVVIDKDVTIVEEAPPLLHNLTSLQEEASQRYGMTAADTLACVQHLYEEGDATYPRTDSRYITSDMDDTVASLLYDTEGNS